MKPKCARIADRLAKLTGSKKKITYSRYPDRLQPPNLASMVVVTTCTYSVLRRRVTILIALSTDQGPHSSCLTS